MSERWLLIRPQETADSDFDPSTQSIEWRANELEDLTATMARTIDVGLRSAEQGNGLMT